MNLLQQASESDTRFGQMFCAYASNFAENNYPRALKSFSPTAKAFIFNHCDSRILHAKPSEFLATLDQKD